MRKDFASDIFRENYIYSQIWYFSFFSLNKDKNVMILGRNRILYYNELIYNYSNCFYTQFCKKNLCSDNRENREACNNELR